MKLGIRFSDNDFWKTISGILNILANRDSENELTKDKKKLKFIINNLMLTSYIINQNHYEYNGMGSLDDDEIQKYLKHMKKYLKIGVRDIFIDDEVDAYIKKCDNWDNGEFFVLNTKTKWVTSM